MSPTTIFRSGTCPCTVGSVYTLGMVRVGEVYPGCGMRVVREGYYTGYYPATLRYPDLVIFSLRGPTHGPLKAILEVSMRFLRYASEWDPE